MSPFYMLKCTDYAGFNIVTTIWYFNTIFHIIMTDFKRGDIDTIHAVYVNVWSLDSINVSAAIIPYTDIFIQTIP